MKKTLISSTSFLNDSNDCWKYLKKKYKLNFSPFGKVFYIDKKYSTQINLIFLPDILEYFNNTNTVSKEHKIKINSFIKLILNLIKNKETNYIVGISDFLFEDTIPNLRIKNTNSDLKIYFLNELYKLSRNFKNLFIFDLDKIFSYSGLKNCFSHRNYYLMNSRLSSDGLNILSKHIDKIIMNINSTNKKVLILDCDNTIWGGVLGEDGFSKIQIGQDGVGRAFRDFQKVIKLIKNRGILIVLASKNEKKDVLEVLKKHKGMILRDEDITSYKVNWHEKSKNINDLSQELMLGLDSFVFWDDNPIEREKVRKKLPKIDVIEPEEDVSEWPKQLSEYIGFLKHSNVKEDNKKTQQYKQRDNFLEKKKLFDDEINYLKSINVKLKIEKLNDSNIDRAVQLTNKTNQFNLTTKRYNHSDIINISKNSDVFLAKLKDIYGDHGIISLIIVKKFNNYAYIDTFLLSCRILGRYVENHLLNFLKKYSIKKKLNGLLIQFIKTKKNTPGLNFLNSIKTLKKLNKKEKEMLDNKKSILSLNKSSFYILKNKSKIINSEIYD
ncbi:HAD-IIIC family phosphatase [Candidatus Pelagibacter sp. HIMB1636]|uniref:HAD-IIIC family phosphatase n=1 Tax=Candidatus Pelagibacter sp. HIMB1636 TaxID=3413360 RepID=UPI003F863D66